MPALRALFSLIGFKLGIVLVHCLLIHDNCHESSLLILTASVVVNCRMLVHRRLIFAPVLVSMISVAAEELAWLVPMLFLPICDFTHGLKADFGSIGYGELNKRNMTLRL